MADITFRASTRAPSDYDIVIDGEAVGTVWKTQGLQYGGKPMWIAQNSSGKIRSDKENTRKRAVEELARKISDAYTGIEVLKEIAVKEPAGNPEPVAVQQAAHISALKRLVRQLASKLTDLMTVEGLDARELAVLRNDLEVATHNLERALLVQDQVEEPETAPAPKYPHSHKLRAANVSAFINSSSEIRTSGPDRQHRHEGIFVRQSMDDVSVHVDIEQSSHRHHLTEELVKLLGERYIVREILRDEVYRFAIIYVTLKD